VPTGFMGATASVLSDAAPSFAAKVGDKPSAPFATVGVPELEVAASGLDVSAICATLRADGGASGG